MSISSKADAATDFDRWIATAFAELGPFTALAVLVEIAGPRVAPLNSTFLNVIGDEIDWGGITLLFAGTGRPWDGAAFFPELAEGGPLDNPTARARLRLLEQRLDDDRLVLNEGHFFDKWGRRMKIEEV
ncbi:hypothetical protein [Tardiphaga sp.]|uniref:hypothetical protein n=1 Tax=Tardiphaga sp. TaxID=1926292 RepID=UPI002616A2BA|nr:hypothetical protein [Tardiphaga sp.]MDB5617161.1 hypothetical protein [Tardiphaga sp.]